MEKTLYFFVSYPRSVQEDPSDIKFISPENKNIIEWIYKDETRQEGKYYYKKIFKVNKDTSKDKGKNYYFEFVINQEKYIITFENKDNIFIYDVTLEVGKKIIKILRKIDQNKIEYNEKMEFFIEALEAKEEKNRINDLFKDTITLYSKKKNFGLLISLFLKINKIKNLCSKLLEKFFNMNKNPKDNDKNMDRKPYLKNYIKDFQEIITEADSLVKNNSYKNNEFYGLLLCYLNYYDYDNFNTILFDLFSNNPKDLYEILLVFHLHFKFPIKQNFTLLNEFIKYIVENEDFTNFNIGLNYIKDIVTFIDIIENNKENIYNKYTKNNEKNIIKMDNNLKLEKPEKEEEIISRLETGNTSSQLKSVKDVLDKINYDVKENNDNKIIFHLIKNIKSIINFSEENKTFIIYFTNNFWKYVLNYYNEPKQDNIYIFQKLDNYLFNTLN